MEEGSPLTIRISSILFLLVPVFLLASCSDHNGTSTYREHEVNDDAYVMVKGTDLYIKELERDIEKVDSGIREDSFHYRDDHHDLKSIHSVSLHCFRNYRGNSCYRYCGSYRERILWYIYKYRYRNYLLCSN